MKAVMLLLCLTLAAISLTHCDAKAAYTSSLISLPPPYESLAPIPLILQENSSPYCVYPPPTPTPTPTTTIPTPIGFQPSPPDPDYYSSPDLPNQNPPPSPTIITPGPPDNLPTPTTPESVPSPPTDIPGSPEPIFNPPIIFPGPPESSMSPPSFEPAPPYYEPTTPTTGGTSPPISTIPSPDGGGGGTVPSPTPTSTGVIPNPPSSTVPSPPDGGDTVPSPTVFEPPVVYPPPSVPPPPPNNAAPQATLWCVAKPSVPDPIVEEAMNYACWSGADCTSIQPNGPCYKPDTIFAHASYAFNSYWQRTKVSGGTCEFGGTAMLVAVDPSYDGCHFIYN